MSQMSGTNSGNASRDPAGFTEITGTWIVPSKDNGQYEVMIRKVTHDQPIHVSPGDTIIKSPIDYPGALVQFHPGTERTCVKMYPDDNIRADCIDDNGNKVSQRRTFNSGAPPLHCGPGRTTLYTVESQSGPDRTFAALLPGQGMSMIHPTLWNLERWPGGKKEERYVMATFGPLAKAGYVKRSEGTARDDSTTMQSNASVS
jgi:hypothetical protein